MACGRLYSCEVVKVSLAWHAAHANLSPADVGGRCTVLALEWPQPYLKKARESQGTATASKSTGDFVVKAKEWERLNVSSARSVGGGRRVTRAVSSESIFVVNMTWLGLGFPSFA